MTAVATDVRIGAAAGVIGSLLGAIANILHPDVPDEADAGAQVIADSRIWVPVHLTVAIAILLMTIGLAAIRSSIEPGWPAAWAVYGLLAAVVGVTVGIVLMAADGVTAKYASLDWTQTHDAAALQVAHFAERVSFGLVAMFNLTFAGATFLLYRLATVASARFPTWLGWVAVLAGVGSIGVAAVQAETGESSPTVEVLTIVFPTVITLWTALMCVLAMRAPVRAPR
jgi:hypothetical protein